MIVERNLPVKTFASSVAISRYDLDYVKAESFSYHKRKIIENLTKELVSCMSFAEEMDKDGNIFFRGRIRVVDDRSIESEE